MKTLADLKRDAGSGKLSLELIERFGKTGNEIKSTMIGIRKVVGCNTVALSLLNNDGNISELRFGSAKLIEYGEDTLTLYLAAHRELTEEEQKILDEWKKIEDDCLAKNPFCETYWKRKDYFASCTCPWLDGSEMKRGKRLEYVNGKPMIRDNSIKGEAVLKYKVHFAREVVV